MSLDFFFFYFLFIYFVVVFFLSRFSLTLVSHACSHDRFEKCIEWFSSWFRNYCVLVFLFFLFFYLSHLLCFCFCFKSCAIAYSLSIYLLAGCIRFDHFKGITTEIKKNKTYNTNKSAWNAYELHVAFLYVFDIMAHKYCCNSVKWAFLCIHYKFSMCIKLCASVHNLDVMHMRVFVGIFFIALFSFILHLFFCSFCFSYFFFFYFIHRFFLLF